MIACKKAGRTAQSLQRKLRLTLGLTRCSGRVHGIGLIQTSMLRRALILALAALTIASPAVAQRFPKGVIDSDRGSIERSDPLTRQVQFPRDQFAPQDDRRDREVPLNSILRDLRSKYGGQHLDAQKIGDRYRISWITEDGRRLVIEVDASTGRTMSVRG